MALPNLRHSSETVGGIVFVGRMLDKIRLHAAGKLPNDYNRGVGSDHRICQFLKVEYPAVVERILKGGTDNELLEWCFQKGRRPAEHEIYIFNAFLSKQGWRDDTTEELQEVKRKRGFANRDDIQTWFDFHRADEA